MESPPAPPRRREGRWRRRFALLLLELCVPVGLVVIWYVASRGSTNFYYPPLREILGAFRDVWLGQQFLDDVPPSLARTGIGFGIALVSGVAFGLAMGSSDALYRFFGPLVEFMRAIPPPLLTSPSILVFGLGDSMRIAVIAGGVVWPILLNTTDAVRGMDEMLRDTARVYRITGMRKLWRVTLPAAGPRIFAGARTSLSLSLILMVISEMIGGGTGIGVSVQNAQRGFDIPEMWAGILLLGMFGFTVNLVFVLVEHRVLRWHRGARRAGRQ